MTKESIREILDAIEAEHLDRLSRWERSFFESVRDWFERTGNLSDGQQDKLEEIWVKLP